MSSLRDTAHAKGVRLTLTVTRMAWNASGQMTTKALLGSSTAIARLAGETAVEVVGRGADGVNLDVELIPTGSGAGFVSLVAGRPRPRRHPPGSRADLRRDRLRDRAPPRRRPGAGRRRRRPPDGLRLPHGRRHDDRPDPAHRRPALRRRRCIDYYLAAGVAPSRPILAPYYGRVWTTADDTAHAAPLPKPSGGPADWSTTVLYETAAGLAQQHGRRWDGTERGAWTAYPKTWPDVPGTYTRQLWFDDAEALAAKYDIVLQRDPRGVGIWALGYDGKRPELAALLRGTFDVPRLAAKVSARAIGLAPGGVAKVFAPRRRRAVDKADRIETAIGRLRILRGTRTVRSYPVAGAGGSIDWNDGTRAGACGRSARIGSSCICGPPTAARHG